MPRFSLLINSTALSLCLPATMALADLTADEVWADWQAYMASTGYVVSGSEARGNGSVTVTDLSMRSALGETPADGALEVSMGTIEFREQGDGTVAVVLPARNAYRMDLAPETGEKIAMTLVYDQTDHNMVASGDPSEITYAYTAQSARMTLDSLTVDGVAIGEDVARIAMTMTDVAYENRTSTDTLRNVAQSMAVAGLSYDLNFADPEGEGTVGLKGAMQGLAFEGAGTLPLQSETQDINAMLSDGFAFDGAFTTQSGNYDMSFSGPDGSGTVNNTSQGADLRASLGPDGLTYDVRQREVNTNMLMTEFPLPLSFSAAEVGTGITMPLQKSNEEQDFGLAITLSDFTMSDLIWGLFDPEGQLPRDPATIAVDLSGKAKVLFDFLDPAQAAVLEETGALPGELNALTLNALTLDVAGAKLTGTGDFVFDNGDLVTFDGMPRPEGTVNLSLVGGNGLLDKLVGMGLVPQDQAMGARMMMGLFAVPGAGPDTLNSLIEVTPEGQVLANGQRIR
ncbi:DUF2125 domain-containing protein [uncultured Tateyamaria sp.]|uniref:DUF2125 domain-containing protein n=1 Tax=uncultured Tateyamaria sp. TaxID=455651 RepID=UPI0026262A04|nr:DUF2125 domain-containing protein [uncultured Tateyamaria sp.]